jgi:hypothetical protein
MNDLMPVNHSFCLIQCILLGTVELELCGAMKIWGLFLMSLLLPRLLVAVFQVSNTTSSLLAFGNPFCITICSHDFINSAIFKTVGAMMARGEAATTFGPGDHAR